MCHPGWYKASSATSLKRELVVLSSARVGEVVML